MGKTRGVKKGSWHQSADHKPGLQSEINRIEQAGGVVRSRNEGSSVPRVDGILALSRSFGDFQLKRPFNKARGDWVISSPTILGPFHPAGEFYAVAASDGVWDQMSSRELTKKIINHVNDDKSRHNLQQLCDEFVDENLQRWKKSKGADNVTLVIMHATSK
jgi:serine/threonine protein phosphatase PrpC